MTMMQQTSEEQDQIRPVQFLTRGELEQFPVPLIRITTCGLLTVEVAEEIVSLDPPLVRYISLTPDQLQGRGTVPAFTLLKLLLNRYERFASHEWLMEQFCCEGELFSSKRINNIVSQLRNLLCSSALPVLQALRMQIVAHVRSSGSGGYQLAAYPLVWVDQDALAWNVEQATRMERFNDPALALPFWERAYEIARHGPYLPDEIYADWSRRQRGEVEGALRQSVQALARLYQEQHGATGEEEALRLLRSYWLEYPHEEDVLRILMELLGKRECTHEALKYYEQLCHVLQEDDREPDSQTRDVAQYLQNKQIQRSPLDPFVDFEIRKIEQDTEKAGILSQVTEAPPVIISPISSKQNLQIFSSSAFVHMLPLEMLPEDAATWLGIRLAHILSFIHQWGKQTISCDILQTIIDREITMFDDLRNTFPSEALTLSRRQALVTLAALPTMLASLLQGQSFPLPPEEFLPQCAASITSCWHLLRGREFLLIEKLLARYLPILADMAHQPLAYQTVAARLATQGYRLIGIVALHRNKPQAREAYYQQAVHYAEIADNPNLLTAALTSLAYHQDDPFLSLPLYNRALHYKTDLSPLLLARLYARFAVVSAQQGQEQEALKYLQLSKETYPDRPQEDGASLYAEFSPASLIMEEGLTYLQIMQQKKLPSYAQQAWETLDRVDQLRASSPIPARIQFEVVNHQTNAALGLNDLDRFCFSLERGVQGAKILQSQQRMQEALASYKTAKEIWPREEKVCQLADLFLENWRIQ